MIQMLSGACRIGARVLRSSDGPFHAGSSTEVRLVQLGVAKYVDSSAEFPDLFAGMKTVQTDVIKPSENAENDGEYSDISDAPDDISEWDFTEESLSGLTNARLKNIAESLGIDTSVLRKKSDYISAILADSPPETIVENPVS